MKKGEKQTLGDDTKEKQTGGGEGAGQQASRLLIGGEEIAQLPEQDPVPLVAEPFVGKLFNRSLGNGQAELDSVRSCVLEGHE